ncbi:chromogranin-A [Lethenteron reissneri]|uniref:chromogranin-A n=1 Tax=Lethenteron reissneri TaxID=7753 RepID=UPI002AB710DE|nr:chromogranin-A [Lethenteron reissneri]
MNRLLLASLCACLVAVSSLPVPATLLTTDDGVARCVGEVVARAISEASPAPATENCLRVLREDERINGFLHRKDLIQVLQQLSRHDELIEARRQQEAQRTAVPDAGANRPVESDKGGEDPLGGTGEWVQHSGEGAREGVAGTGRATTGERAHLVKQGRPGNEATHDDDDDDDDDTSAAVDKKNVNYRNRGGSRRGSEGLGIEERNVETGYDLRGDGLEHNAAEPRVVTKDDVVGDDDDDDTRERARGDGATRSIEKEDGEVGRDDQTIGGHHGGARFSQQPSDERESERPAPLTLSEQERNAAPNHREGDDDDDDDDDDRHQNADGGHGEAEEGRSSRATDLRAGLRERRGREGESEGEKVEEELIRMTLQSVGGKVSMGEEPARHSGSTGGPSRDAAEDAAAATAALLPAERERSDDTPGVMLALGDAVVAKRESAAAAGGRGGTAATRQAGREIGSEGLVGNPHGAADRGSRAAAWSSSEEDKELAEIAAIELELENIVNKIEDLKRG